MYRKADRGWLKHWDFTLLDALCLQAAYIAAYWLRQGISMPYKNPLYCNMAFVFVLIQVFVTFFGESFKNVLKRGYYQEFTNTVRHVCLVMLVAVFYLFATQKRGKLLPDYAGGNRHAVRGIFLHSKNLVETIFKEEGNRRQRQALSDDSDLQSHGEHRGGQYFKQQL